jgi:hypothetical protein
MLVLIKPGKMKLGFSQSGLNNPATVDELHHCLWLLGGLKKIN